MSSFALNYEKDLEIAKYLGFVVEHEYPDYITLTYSKVPTHAPRTFEIYKSQSLIDNDSPITHMFDMEQCLITIGKWLKAEEIKQALSSYK